MTPLSATILRHLQTEAIGKPAPLEIETLIFDAGWLSEFDQPEDWEVVAALAELVEAGRVTVKDGVCEAVLECLWPVTTGDRRLFP